jgi:hypothetical protein
VPYSFSSGLQHSCCGNLLQLLLEATVLAGRAIEAKPALVILLLLAVNL